MGFPPISTIGFGRTEVSSLILVPIPPARMTTFIDSPCSLVPYQSFLIQIPGESIPTFLSVRLWIDDPVNGILKQSDRQDLIVFF